MNIVLFGPPGAGKSTFAGKLVGLLQLSHICTGDLLRDNLARLTPLGRQVKGYLDAGALVPDDVAINLLIDKVSHTGAHNLLLDGFPRTLTQAMALENLMKVDFVINIVSKDGDLIKRLLARGRAGETEEVIKTRLDVYKAQSAPCVEFFHRLNKIRNIDGSGSIDEVFERIQGAVK